MSYKRANTKTSDPTKISIGKYYFDGYYNSKDYNIVSYQLEEKTVGEMTTYYVTMVIKSKKYNDEGMLLTLLQDFHDITVHRIE